jgi:hypothetical protein
MADASLNIPITADASKFLSTLGQVEDRLKELKVALKDAVGADIGKINIEIQGLEQQKSAIKDFGKFAEGTYGSLLQRLNDLKDYQLTLNYNGAEFKKVQADIDTTKAEIKKLTSTPAQIEVKFEAPQGSIAGLKKQIKELEFMKSIQVDTTAIEQYANLINKLKSELKGLESIGVQLPAPKIDDTIVENSILDLRNQIDKLNAKKINIDVANEGEIAAINTQIDGLSESIKRAESLGFDKNGKVSENAGKARIALTNLKLVVQDLPFGFIAIQNNLPNLIESFDTLRGKGGGVRGALKELGGQLAGPGGLFLAFSAVTTAITYAVQEYGSLGAAVDALLGKQLPLAAAVRESAKAYAEFNKEKKSSEEISSSSIATTEAEVRKIKTLSDIVLDQTKSYNERNAALNTLKEIDKDYFGNLSLEKTKFDDLTLSVNGYIGAIQQAAITKGFSDELSKTSVELDKAENLLVKLSQQLDFANAQEKVVGIAAIKIKDQALIEQATKDYENQKSVVDELQASFNDLNAKIDESVRKENAIKAPVDAANAAFEELKRQLEEARSRKIDFKFDLKLSDDYKEFIKYDSLDKALERLKQYGDTILDVNKSELERGKALKGLIVDSKSILGVNTQLFDGFKLGVTPVSQISDAIDNYGFAIQDLIIKEKELIKLTPARNNYFESVYKTIAKGLTGGDIAGAIDTTGIDEAFNRIKEAADKLPKDVNASFGEFKNTFPTLDQFKEKVNEIIQLELFKTGKLDFSQISEIVTAELAALESVVNGISKVSESTKFLKDQLELAYTAINQVFFAPLENLFETFFTTGKIAFKDFTKSVLKSIADIAAKLAATGVIKGLLFLLDPSGALAGLGGSFGGAGGGNGILDALGGVFGRSQRKPDFNRVSPPRTYGGDRVEFTIRGTNLVGVLNRANGEINRIG